MDLEEIKRVTLADLADHTGLSKATVSRAINNQPNVSAKNRKLVMDAVRKLRYRPDPALSALAKHRWNVHSPRFRSYSIAILQVTSGKESSSSTDHVEAGTNREIYAHLRKCAEDLEIVFDFFTSGDHSSSDALGKVLFNRGFDGVVACVFRPMLDWTFPWKHFAVVTVGFDHPSHKSHSVCSDWAGAVNLAFEKALEGGAKRPAFAIFRHKHPLLDRDIEGAARALLARHFGNPTEMPPFFYDDASIYDPSGKFAAPSKSGFAKWFNRHRPDCVIDGNRIAIWWMLEMGLKVPSEVQYSSLLCPGTARDVSYPGINHHYALQGACAMERVISLIQLNRRGLAELPLRTLFPCSWGASVADLSPDSIRKL